MEDTDAPGSTVGDTMRDMGGTAGDMGTEASGSTAGDTGGMGDTAPGITAGDTA